MGVRGGCCVPCLAVHDAVLLGDRVEGVEAIVIGNADGETIIRGESCMREYVAWGTRRRRRRRSVAQPWGLLERLACPLPTLRLFARTSAQSSVVRWACGGWRRVGARDRGRRRVRLSLCADVLTC
jgi:hypothetical protein